MIGFWSVQLASRGAANGLQNGLQRCWKVGDQITARHPRVLWPNKCLPRLLYVLNLHFSCFLGFADLKLERAACKGSSVHPALILSLISSSRQSIGGEQKDEQRYQQQPGNWCANQIPISILFICAEVGRASRLHAHLCRKLTNERGLRHVWKVNLILDA